jgi:hypothetical protein
MTSPLPPHLAQVIRERIALLREAWNLDEVPSQPRLRAYPTHSARHAHDARSW